MGEQRPELWWAESIVGANNRSGLVKFTIGKEEKTVTPDEARAFATSIFEAAEAAEMDEVVVRFLTENIGLELPAAVMCLRDFRTLRATRKHDA